jgi:uncharacterized protein YjiS (DUF1127 family)
MSQTFILARPRAGVRVSPNQNLLSRWIQRLDIWLTRRQGREDLRQLDDRMLADVGISRADAGISRQDALWRAGMPLP